MFAALVHHRGYLPLYSTGMHCPGCGKRNWLVGRFSAECGFCATALPFAPIAGKPGAPNAPSWADRP